MNLKQLEYFVQVAELGSFSKAAVVLEIAQPALSRQVRALETELHETLLLRNGRGVSLTEAGQRLFDHSVGILQQVALALEDLGEKRDAPVGRITIGLPPSIGRQLTLPLVDGFRRELPQAKLVIVEGLSTHIAEWITTGLVDIGLIYNPDPVPAINVTPVLEEALCLVAPRTAGQTPAGTTVPLRELSAYPLVVPERRHVIRRVLESQAVLVGLELDIAWEVSSVAAIIDLVCAGYGHAVLTASAVAASGRAAELSVRPLVDPGLISVLCLATAAHKRPSPLMRHAATMLQALARETPQVVENPSAAP